MIKKNVNPFVQVIFLYPEQLPWPSVSLHRISLKELMERGYYLDDVCLLVEYVDGERTHVVRVSDGQYHPYD